MWDWLYFWRGNAASKELRRLTENAMITLEDARAALEESTRRSEKEIRDGRH